MFRVLAFTIKPRESPDTRYRVLQYQSAMQTLGITIDHCSLVGARYFQWQIKNQQALVRLVLYPLLLTIRLWQVLFVAAKYDAVLISREMAPLGPPLFEWILLSRCKRVVLDIDDALHVADKDSSRLIPRLLRDHGKFGSLAAAYATVVCGNQYLADFYHQRGANVAIIPTVVDTDRYGSTGHVQSQICRVGWIGTPLNRHHLESLRSVFESLAVERKFELVVVGLNEPLNWNTVDVRHVRWSLVGELDFFSHFDIGVMPLIDSPFARGKCAFKLVQYMAAGLPVIASPVGANCEVVREGVNGFLAETQEEWKLALRALIDDIPLRRRLGQSGRQFVRGSYSVDSAWPIYAQVLTGATIGKIQCEV